ncbi:uncharacterized protein [Chlorocebus sabaeus]|uniref:uncharacterized protein isoform X8 n=1 Tax=Chlorocebus sabaeus TaxID=60711 RepID=UPI003BF97AD7
MGRHLVRGDPCPYSRGCKFFFCNWRLTIPPSNLIFQAGDLLSDSWYHCLDRDTACVQTSCLFSLHPLPSMQGPSARVAVHLVGTRNIQDPNQGHNGHRVAVQGLMGRHIRLGMTHEHFSGSSLRFVAPLSGQRYTLTSNQPPQGPGFWVQQEKAQNLICGEQQQLPGEGARRSRQDGAERSRCRG